MPESCTSIRLGYAFELQVQANTALNVVRIGGYRGAGPKLHLFSSFHRQLAERRLQLPPKFDMAITLAKVAKCKSALQKYQTTWVIS
jgi:hypothetical protein